jgi:transcriptional regulator with XRE-family HTH domain
MVLRSYWWSSYGNFEPDGSGLYPQAHQVVTHYRRLSGLSRDYLAGKLGVGAKALYYAEYEGRGLDSIARLRELRLFLDIPPALLGLCDAPGPAGWWLNENKSLLVGADGWPDVGAVVKYFRRAKGWTQAQLAESLGIRLLGIQKMENSGSSLDSLSRRRALRFLLGIPPVLLGIDSEHIAKEVNAVLIGSAKGPAPELITSFRASADALFSGYYSGHAQDRVQDTLSWLAEAREIRSMAQGSQRLEMLQIESLGYQALANIEREYAPDVVVFSHSNRAVQLARDSGNSDVLSVALQRRAETAIDRGYVDLAQRSMREALILPVEDQAEQIVRTVAAPHVLSVGVSDEQERKYILSLIYQARPTVGLPDTFRRQCDTEAVAMRQAQALNRLAAHAPEVQARDLLRRSSDLLISLAPASARRAIMIKLALAQALLGLGELDGATTIALETLPLMDQIKSVLYLPQLQRLYLALRKSSLRSDPRVARLGLYLHEHGVL